MVVVMFHTVRLVQNLSRNFVTSIEMVAPDLLGCRDMLVVIGQGKVSVLERVHRDLHVYLQTWIITCISVSFTYIQVPFSQ